MLLFSSVLLTAQNKDTVVVITAHSAFVNGSDETYFAMSRTRIEKLLVKAAMSDSLEKFWRADNQKLTQQIADADAEGGFWRTVAILCASVVAVVMAVK
jgi:hypothetical protein